MVSVENISLGYSLPLEVNQVQTRLFFSWGKILFLFSDYPGTNPDVNRRGGVILNAD